MVKLLAERAFAKINLFLRVTGRRADGYHELDSIFLPISLSDRDRYRGASRADCERHFKMQHRLARRCPKQPRGASGARVHASLQYFRASDDRFGENDSGGRGPRRGSSDAGTVLRMLSTMMLQTSSDSSKRLHEIAVGLGADVPFFLNPRPSRISGIGERIEAIENFPILHLVVAVPPIEVPTASVFKELRRNEWSGTASSEDIDEILGGAIVGRHLVNDLEAPALRLYPPIARLKALLQECGATACAMSGSGGSVFGLFSGADAASSAATALRQASSEASVFVAESILI